uniref:Uncharacterized protein n=1 Tax=Arundo donax TaxID=35708 RepID=A0A0A9EBK2_ARUDO
MPPPRPPAASKLQSRETDSEISTQDSGCGGPSAPAALSPPPRIQSSMFIERGERRRRSPQLLRSLTPPG